MTQEAGTPREFLGQIRKMIEDAVAKAMRSGPLRNASISGGALTIKEGGTLRAMFPASLGGGLGAYWGDIKNEADGSYLGTGILVQDENGMDIAQFRTDAATGGTLALLIGANGGQVLSTHTSEMGLKRPYLQGGFVPARYADWTVSSTSATFETLWRSNTFKQHAAIFCRTKASMDTAATSGEVRLLVNSVQIGATETIGFAQTTVDFGPANVPGDHMDWLDVEIQGRRTSAGGALRVAPGVWIGREA